MIQECRGESGTECQNGVCLNLFQNTQTGDPIGVCTASCRSHSDCPQSADILGSSNYDPPVAYKGICTSLRWGYNGTPNVLDDFYLPICLPENPDSTLTDCSGSQKGVGDQSKCGDTEVCTSFMIATTPDVETVVEFLCVTNAPSSSDPNPPAPKEAGESCEQDSECKSTMCLNGGTNGDFCSSLCDPTVTTSCDGIPNTSCLKGRWMPRVDESMEGFIYVCQRTDQTCLPCFTSSSCSNGYTCNNTSDVTDDFRCVPECTTDSDCGDGGKCGTTTDAYGVESMGCTNTACQ